MNRGFRIWITWLLFAAVVAFSPKASLATMVYLPEVQGTSGESIGIPIMIDRVDNLAGVKLVMEYDPKILSFKKGARTGHTDSFMHVINDKNPGRLIIVMAGAKGVKGKAFPLLTLTFKVKEGLKKDITTQPVLTEIELMTDKLKEIKCDLEANTVRISPQPEKAIPRQKTSQGKKP